MKTKDFNAQFERMKDFKQKYPEATDNDEFFKALYSRLRKYVKKLNKLDETEGKIQKGVELTPEQREMLKKKSELKTALEEMVTLNSEYIKNFDNHCEQIWAFRNTQVKEEHKEEVKEEVEQEEEPQQEEPEPVTKQPQVDVEAIRQEEYDRGFREGRQNGYEDGRTEAYQEGKNDGYSQAKQEFDSQTVVTQQSSASGLQKAANYTSLISVLAQWIDNLMPMDPPFKRNDYFTENECYAIKQLYMLNQMMPQALNFKRMVDSSSERTLKLVNQEDEAIPNCQNVTYKQLAESIDRVLKNPQFVNTSHQFYTSQDFMMGFGGYNAMPGVMPGQMMGQMPGMMPAGMPGAMPGQMPTEMPVNFGNKVGGNVEAFNTPVETNAEKEASSHEVEIEEEEQPADEENTPAYHEPVAEEPTQEVAQDEERDLEKAATNPAAPADDPWANDDYDDDEDEDDEENDSQDEAEEDDTNKENKAADLEQQPESGEAKDQTQHHTRPYQKKDYQRGGYNRGYGNRGYNKNYYGSGGNYRGGRGYNNKWQGHGGRGGRGGRRGGRYRDERGGRGRGYYQDNYQDNYHENWQENPYEETKQEKQPEPKTDDDGFNIVQEKTFVQKKNKRGGRGKPRAPKQPQNQPEQ